MLTKRIIPCLDVKDSVVVKGVQFKSHQVMGSILEYAKYYRDAGADELVFYDITASSDGRLVDKNWISDIARLLDIPFCVAGGIRSIADARLILNSGADKISINSPALENPKLISMLAEEFGSQCVVVGIDSHQINGDYYVYQYTGDETKIRAADRKTMEWAIEAENLGAGEIVLNCMNQDGVKNGYDIRQLSQLRSLINVPIIASGGAGQYEHFNEVFDEAKVDGALAASVFHTKHILIPDLKEYLRLKNIKVRL
ncbi:MAG: imidazole glycerol phosphate synthase subunit HisF [Gammaproteobacteria bacterium]|nr:imidazole glycerol phosphate synthase subunit HisF [Gammaproteobacteria bacterium]